MPQNIILEIATYNMNLKTRFCVWFGVKFDSKLSFVEHINEKINKVYSILGIIKRNFIYMDKDTFILLYKAMVRPHLEYAYTVWCASTYHILNDYVSSNFVHLRRLRGDMIEVF